MPKQKAMIGPPTAYEKFCDSANITPIKSVQAFSGFTQSEILEKVDPSICITSGLLTFLKYFIHPDEPKSKIDKAMIEACIAKIDDCLNEIVNEILHHEEFKTIESLWRSADYLIQQTEENKNTKVELLDLKKEILMADFEEAIDIKHSGLYRHVYINEYDTPGGEPFAAMITNYTFDAGIKDITLLKDISAISSLSHCPFWGNVSSDFFNKCSFDKVQAMDNIAEYTERAEYIRWSSFRETEDSRYIGLCMPQFLLRIPYVKDQSRNTYSFSEEIDINDKNGFL